ncbi:MAG: tyrosine-protein phosphatase [Acidobacteriia bacterium]|nr:tyrosine-protein phosphatase [Terriglobia bacterium]
MIVQPRFWVLCSLFAAPLLAADPAGLPNFHQVNGQVYRGAQPTEEGLRYLAKLGVKVIVNLRGDSTSIAEKKLAEAAGMRYVSIPLPELQAPSPEKVAEVLQILNDAAAGPVFVHCRRGADRTGTVIACYRIAHDGWDNSRALHEARQLGMSWVERGMQHYVLHYRADQAASTQPAVVPAAALAR